MMVSWHSSFAALYRHSNMIRTIMFVVLSISSLFLSTNWSASSSLYIFNQTVFAFQPSNQHQEEGQQQQEILLLLSSSSSNDPSDSVTNTNTSTSGHPSSPPLQDSQRGTTATITVEIVLGGAVLGNKSYHPNPLITGPNTTIIWHNTDEILHTVASGLGTEDNMRGKEFDSPIIAPGETYIHTFTEIGEYPYFCVLHPAMVGKIIVNYQR
jgi:plastocyanin